MTMKNSASNKKSTGAEGVSTSLASMVPSVLTILSNVRVNPKVSTASTHPDTFGENGGASDVGVLQVPYQGNEQDIAVEIADEHFEELPHEILQLLDDMGNNDSANVEMVASIPKAIETNVTNEIEEAILNLQRGLISQQSLQQPDLQQFSVPAPVTPLNDDDDMEDFVVPAAKKCKTSSSHLKKYKVPQPTNIVPKKRASQSGKVGVAVKATSSSTSRSTPSIKEYARGTGGSKLKDLLMAPQSILPNNKKSKATGSMRKNVCRKNEEKRFVGGSATTCIEEINDKNKHDSDSESDFQVFSQDHCNSAAKTFQWGINELKKRQEAAKATVQDAREKARLAEEELDRLNKRVKEVESTLRREQTRMVESQGVVNSVNKKLELIRQRVWFWMRQVL